MYDIIALIVLIGSLAGLVVILFRKIPILAEMSLEQAAKPMVFTRIRSRIKDNRFVKIFSGYVILHKILSKFRIFILKIENMTSELLRRLRQRAIENKKTFGDDYWLKLRSKLPRKNKKDTPR